MSCLHGPILRIFFRVRPWRVGIGNRLRCRGDGDPDVRCGCAPGAGRSGQRHIHPGAVDRTLPEDAHVTCSGARLRLCPQTPQWWRGAGCAGPESGCAAKFEPSCSASTSYRVFGTHRKYGCSAVGCPLGSVWGPGTHHVDDPNAPTMSQSMTRCF